IRAEAQARKETFRYTQRADYDHGKAMERMAREEHVLRLKVPPEPIVVRDEVLGEIRFTSEHFDDFVIRKKDGFPTYHFAVVVDDALMGVTHVLRGQEHLNNTPKHVALQRALGFDTPVYAHMPLIFNEKGAKMSKRERDQAARQAVREAKMTASPVGSIAQGEFDAWLRDKTKQLGHDELEALAAHLH
ncbi:MAG: glutamate--tRNA ligase, partial [Candidatus Competibacteraceae bacterium]|nr:glutamate--tRNA ligase [Candidatus Competibacteraceae bacterium]